MTDITPTQELDARRLPGPQLARRVAGALDSLASGDVLKVVISDPSSVADLAAFSGSTGHRIVDQSEGGGELTFMIRKA